MNIKPFIFCWKDQVGNVIEIEKQLGKIFNNVSVINSNGYPKKNHWINLPDDSMFTKQFLHAIDNFNEDFLFHIQGDIKYDKWDQFIQDAKTDFERYNWGIYAADLDNTPWKAENVNYSKLNEHLSCVYTTDTNVWIIHKDIVNIFKNLKIDWSVSNYGWGLDTILSAICYKNNRRVIRNYKHLVHHPPSRMYNDTIANNEHQKIAKQLTGDLRNLVKNILETINF